MTSYLESLDAFIGNLKPDRVGSPIRRMVYFIYAWVIEITLVSAHDNLIDICLLSRESSSTWNAL